MTRSASARVASRRSHTCSLCGQVGFGNGFESSHGRAHVRRGEAVELVRYYGSYPPMSSRLFLRPDDRRVDIYLSEGFAMVES